MADSRDVNTENLTWQKSSRCATGACVEIAHGGEGGNIHLRDSKNPAQPHLTFDRDQWTAFLAGVREGDFDH